LHTTFATFSPALSILIGAGLASPIGLTHLLLLGAFVFVCGVVTILHKRNAISILIGVELVLNAANINLVAAGRFAPVAAEPLAGQVFAIFIIILAAAEAAVALAIFLNFYNNFSSIDIDRATDLHG
jgi:NADH-quinone oxidoreductase subunit K